MKQWSEILDLFVVQNGMNAIGEENYRYLSLKVKPKRGTGEPEVAKRLSREIATTAGIRRCWGVKP